MGLTLTSLSGMTQTNSRLQRGCNMSPVVAVALLTSTGPAAFAHPLSPFFIGTNDPGAVAGSIGDATTFTSALLEHVPDFGAWAPVVLGLSLLGAAQLLRRILQS